MERLSKEAALDLIRHADLKELGLMATARKKALHPKGITTFVVDRNINYTNVCWVDCKFCAFYRHGKDDDAYVLTFEEIDQKIDEPAPRSSERGIKAVYTPSSKSSGTRIWWSISIPHIPRLPSTVFLPLKLIISPKFPVSVSVKFCSVYM